MEITETHSEGFKRELTVVVGAKEIEDKVSRRLEELKGQVNLKGFRPGKVPVSHIKKLYGKSIAAEVVQQTVAETSQKALTDRELKPAHEPDLEFTEDKDEIEKIMEGRADLSYKLSFEILPDIEIADLSKIQVEKLVAEVTDEAVDEGLDRLLENGTTFEEKEGKADTGDRVTIDFVGKIDGEEFEGGSAEGTPVIIGQNAFIPGFEEGLLGAAKAEKKEVKTTFPDDYPAENLAGKDVVFDVTVQGIAAPKKPELNEEFATNMGLESVEKLRDAVKERIQQEYEEASRTKLKRLLLDKLDETHQFEIPPKLVENEFNAIWERVTNELKQADKTFEDEGTTEDEARKDYEKVCERRVRLGLVLSEIGDKNEITVSEEEIRRAVFEKAQQYPGQEKEVIEFYQKNPQAMAELRAPIFEERVVDFIVELAETNEKSVTVEELFAQDPEDGDETGKKSEETDEKAEDKGTE